MAKIQILHDTEILLVKELLSPGPKVLTKFLSSVKEYSFPQVNIIYKTLLVNFKTFGNSSWGSLEDAL